MAKKKRTKYVLSLKDAPKKPTLVGDLVVVLTEMKQACSGQKVVQVQDGFVLTTAAYTDMLQAGNLRKTIKKQARRADAASKKEQKAIAKSIRTSLTKVGLPKSAEKDLLKAYAKIQKKHGAAVRLTLSIGGEHARDWHPSVEELRNIRGEKSLITAVQKLYAAFFSDEAFLWRESVGQDHMLGIPAIIIRPEVDAKAVVSGTIAVDHLGQAQIKSNWGLTLLGDADVFTVFLDGVRREKHALIRRTLGQKTKKTGFGKLGITKKAPTAKEKKQFSCTDEQLVRLARTISASAPELLAQHAFCWTQSHKGEFTIDAALPYAREHIQDRKAFKLNKKGAVLARGTEAAYGIVSSKLIRLDAPSAEKLVEQGNIVLGLQPAFFGAAAEEKAGGYILVEEYDWTATIAHARERGIPAMLISTADAEKLKHGKSVTLDALQRKATIYKGVLPFEIFGAPELKKRTTTQVGVQLAHTANAPYMLGVPSDHIGRVRMEDVIQSRLSVHPNCWWKSVQASAGAQKKMKDAATGFASVKAFAVEHVAAGIAEVAAAVYPKPVMVQCTQVTARPYQKLTGAPKKKQLCAGTLDCYQGAYASGIALELAALKKVREEWGLTNVHIGIPVCRTPEEAQAVRELFEKHGLAKGKDGLQIGVAFDMAENQMLTDAFAKQFDMLSVSLDDVMSKVVEDTGVAAQIFAKKEKEKQIRHAVKMLTKHARAHRARVNVVGNVLDVDAGIFDVLLAEGVTDMTVEAHQALALRGRLAEREKTHGRLAKRMSTAYMGIVAMFVTLSAGLLTVGSGCAPTLEPAQDGASSYIPPAVMRQHLEEKIQKEMSGQIIEAELNRRIANRLPEFTLDYPDNWSVRPAEGGITFLDPDDDDYISVYRPLPPRMVPEPISEKRPLVVDGQAAFGYDALGADGEMPVDVVEMILPNGDTLLIEGNGKQFEEMVESLSFSFAHFEDGGDEHLLETICIQMITYAEDPETGQCSEFPTPCDVPEGWKNCQPNKIQAS